ncbi:MAG: hypothetical protein ACLP9K_04125 [Nitrososphaerales archaeon]
MTTKEEALKHLKELEKKVDDFKPAMVAMRNRCDVAEEQAVDLGKQLAANDKRIGELEVHAKKAEALYSAMVNFFEPLGVQVVGANPGSATLANTITELTEHDVKKQAEFSTDSIKGRAISVIAHGKQGRRWKVTEVKEAIDDKWGTIDGKSLGIELMRATVDDGILARAGDGHSHFLYFLPENVVLKEKT